MPLGELCSVLLFFGGVAEAERRLSRNGLFRRRWKLEWMLQWLRTPRSRRRPMKLGALQSRILVVPMLLVLFLLLLHVRYLCFLQAR
jgi:hypothetical protein